jgi:hypothetical protein
LIETITVIISISYINQFLEYEEAKARYWAVKMQPQWVVTPGKQTNKH